MKLFRSDKILFRFIRFYSSKRSSYQKRHLEENIRFLMTKRKKLALTEVVPSTITIEILSNGTSHMAPSMLLRTPFRAYLFNSPEGLSRFLPSLRIRPNMIHDIFMTRDNWQNIGGAPGMIMNKEDSDEDIRIHGPSSISQFLEVLRPEIDMETDETSKRGGKFPVKIDVRDLKRGFYEDITLHVDYLPLTNSAERKYLEHGPSNLFCMAYLVKLKPTPPSLDTLKLINLKVPLGPWIARLKTGESITLNDGRVIRPEDVTDYKKTAQEWPNLLVVDINSEENLESITSDPIIQDYTTSGSSPMNFVVHFTPPNIFSLPAYRQWMQCFGLNCKHLVLNGQGKVIPLSDRIFEGHNLLREMFPEAFPELYPHGIDYEGRVFTQDDKHLDLHIKDDKTGPIIVPGFLRRFSMRGSLEKKGPQETIGLKFTPRRDKLLERIQEEPELGTEITKFKRSVAERIHQIGNEKEQQEYPRVTFFGTGSAMPTHYRNVTSHLLQTNENSNFLIDCGECTYGQMLTLFGPDECTKILANLHAIFLTHTHQDHILGTFLVIQRRIEALKKLEMPHTKLLMFCERGYDNILKAFRNCFGTLHDATKVTDQANLISTHSRDADSKGSGRAVDLLKFIPEGFEDSVEGWNLRSVRAISVQHTKWAVGYAFETAVDGKKIVFSGDTKPCDNLVECGRGADLLIHEATFEDGMESDADRKKHSTMKQAFDVAMRMGAKHTIFTHFSSRYAHTPPLPDYLLEAGNFSIAKDNMVVPYGLLPVFPKFLPIYRLLFREELVDLERKQQSRDFRKTEEGMRKRQHRQN